jgi:hypothetical protein
MKRKGDGKKTKKLQLQRNTVRVLSGSDLRKAAGGIVPNTNACDPVETETCSKCSMPPTIQHNQVVARVR